MTCQDAIEIMGDYLEATLGEAVGDELQRHLDECDECTAYLNTYRKTRDLVADGRRLEMPADLKARLRSFLLARLSAADPRG
jgi:anti-sigma factor RsiW